jgi:hypothetical protein
MAIEGAQVMTQTQDTTTLLTPARRRSVSVVPVLIQIPKLEPSRAPRRRVRRRRLRREVRVAGYLLLASLPVTIAFASLGGYRVSPLSASSVAIRSESEASTSREVPAVSLSLEPVSSVSRDLEAPVFLPGILLPADSTEEAGDGGH